MTIWTFDSTSLTGIKYFPDQKWLTVYFKTGKAWIYSDVPESVYLAFRDAPSPGKFYAREIKGKYPGKPFE